MVDDKLNWIVGLFKEQFFNTVDKDIADTLKGIVGVCKVDDDGVDAMVDDERMQRAELIERERERERERESE